LVVCGGIVGGADARKRRREVVGVGQLFHLTADLWPFPLDMCGADDRAGALDAGPVPRGGQVVDIVADGRECPSETFAILRSRPDVALTVATLRYGDYSIAGQLSVERKTAEDLGRSIIDGRLFRQMSALRRHADRPVLLVEGLQPFSMPSGVPWHAARGALVSVAVAFGVPILSAQGPEESAEIMVTAARQLAQAMSLAHLRPGYRPKGWRRRALFILQGLPHVGPDRARALLDAFGSVAAIVSADAKRLAEVDGIGAGVSASILKAIGAEPPPDPPGEVQDPALVGRWRRTWNRMHESGP
jgi:DNA excision repair protein ERCC-4